MMALVLLAIAGQQAIDRTSTSDGAQAH